MSAALKRVLFVCIGNACRSQMAEAFARAYGGDVISASSAGLSPAMFVAADTLRAMADKNVEMRQQFPKSVRVMARSRFDIVVNMSGAPLPTKLAPRVENWDVPDPVSMDYPRHCEIRDRIELLVMNLILELRRDPDRAPSG